MTTTTVPVRRVPALVPGVIAVAWLLAVAAQASGQAAVVDHDALVEGGLPVWAALGLFLLAWPVMVAAMMLPSTLPMVRLFTVASRDQERRGTVLSVFLGGYVLVWTAFGALAFVGDVALHRLVEATPVLEEREWLVSGAVLALAGAFQFSSLKDRCLDACRHPGAYLLRHYRRGIGSAFRLGWAHGVFCLGCCWALMVVMFAAGVANLSWMAVLTAVMVYEKVGRHGRRLTPVIGVALLAWAGLVLVHPSWLPGPLAGVD